MRAPAAPGRPPDQLLGLVHTEETEALPASQEAQQTVTGAAEGGGLHVTRDTGHRTQGNIHTTYRLNTNYLYPTFRLNVQTTLRIPTYYVIQTRSVQ